MSGVYNVCEIKRNNVYIKQAIYSIMERNYSNRVEVYIGIMKKAVSAKKPNDVSRMIEELDTEYIKEFESIYNPFNPLAQKREPEYLRVVRKCVNQATGIMHEPYSTGKWHDESKSILKKGLGKLEEYLTQPGTNDETQENSFLGRSASA